MVPVRAIPGAACLDLRHGKIPIKTLYSSTMTASKPRRLLIRNLNLAPRRSADRNQFCSAHTAAGAPTGPQRAPRARHASLATVTELLYSLAFAGASGRLCAA